MPNLTPRNENAPGQDRTEGVTCLILTATMRFDPEKDNRDESIRKIRARRNPR